MNQKSLCLDDLRDAITNDGNVTDIEKKVKKKFQPEKIIYFVVFIFKYNFHIFIKVILPSIFIGSPRYMHEYKMP